MNRIVVKSKVGEDGVLHLDLPIGVEDADKEVQVTVESLPAEPLSEEEWRKRVMELAGKWQGEFERPEQWPLEERDPL